MDTNNVQKHYLIYQITNLINGKIYVGKHITENPDDDYMGSGTLIIKAIKKYGLSNFKKDILFECSSEDEMNKKEAEIVNESFVARDDTYNIVTGGGGGYSNVVFYANRILNEKLKNDMVFKRRFSEACSHCFEHASPEMKERYRDGARRAGRKTKGTVYLFNDSESRCIRVKRDNINSYLDAGWKIGRKSYTTTYMMDKENHRHSVSNQEIEHYLNLGWTLCGRGIPGKVNNKPNFELHSFDRSNFITVHNIEEMKSIRINPLDLDVFLERGWVRGKGSVHIHKDGMTKQVYIWDLPKYESEGWIR